MKYPVSTFFLKLTLIKALEAHCTLSAQAQHDTFPRIDIPIDEVITIVNEQFSPGTFILQTDQDFFFITPASRNEDRNYTQGTTFGYSNPALIESWTHWPQRKIKNMLQAPTDFSSSLTIGGTAFTPRIIDSDTPILGERPFAFLFYVSTESTWQCSKAVSRRSGDKSSTLSFDSDLIAIYHTFRINYGLLGTRLGYEFQSFAHKHIVKGRPTDPKGWNTQISNGGRPTFLLEYNRLRPLISANAKSIFNSLDTSRKNGAFRRELIQNRRLFDAGWNLGGSIGYYERIYTNLFARFGYLKKANMARWNNGGWGSISGASYQMLNPGTVRSRLESEKWQRFKSYMAQNLECFVYGSVTTTVMARNAMLMGQRFSNKDEYTLDPEWVKTGIFELEWGIVLAFFKKRPNEQSPRVWGIKGRQVYRSPEFDSGFFDPRWHYFGGLGIFISVR